MRNRAFQSARGWGLLRLAAAIGLAPLLFSATSACSGHSAAPSSRGDTTAPGEDLGSADLPGDSDAQSIGQDTDTDQGRGNPHRWGLSPISGPANFAVASAGWLRGDLHYHTDFSDDARKQGGDPLSICLDIADYYRHADFTSRWPELEGNALDFVAITDHRQDTAIIDPAFTHDHLILLPGEEYGGAGHANIFGLKQHIPHQPQADESQDQRHRDAILEAHAQGALFSVNHPLDSNNWVWNTPNIDSIELVNGPWAGFYMGSTDAELEADIAAGVENPFVRSAQTHGGIGHNAKALRFWQNHLTAGLHKPIVGGSDRHMIVPVGLPTTYVRQPAGDAWHNKQGPALGVEGVLEGIRQGGTFVSRSPFGPQVDLVAVGADGTRYPLGAELAGPGTYIVEAKVSRAQGGVLRLIAGPLLNPDADGRYNAEPSVVWEQPIDHEVVSGSFAWEVPSNGAWLHAFVLEPVAVGPLSPTLQAALEAFREPRDGDALLVMATALMPLIDVNILFDPSLCDPDAWEADLPQCITVDRTTLGTFHLPDPLVRLVNTYFEDGEPTDYCFGAVSSAFLARPAVSQD